jgi:hypothetical protein
MVGESTTLPGHPDSVVRGGLGVQLKGSIRLEMEGLHPI